MFLVCFKFRAADSRTRVEVVTNKWEPNQVIILVVLFPGFRLMVIGPETNKNNKKNALRLSLGGLNQCTFSKLSFAIETVLESDWSDLCVRGVQY